jgi:hypothetical protein
MPLAEFEPAILATKQLQPTDQASLTYYNLLRLNKEGGLGERRSRRCNLHRKKEIVTAWRVYDPLLTNYSRK